MSKVNDINVTNITSIVVKCSYNPHSEASFHQWYKVMIEKVVRHDFVDKKFDFLDLR